MALQPIAYSGARFLFAEVKKFHLRPIKKLSFQFDPFHHNAKSVRDILFHLSSRRIRKTSDTCVIKTDVVCDRSEPTINIDLHNGVNVLFKCAYLSPVEIAREFNNIVAKYDVKEEKPAIKLKGALQSSGRKRK